MLGETFRAVNGLVAGGLEGNRVGLAAIVANYFEAAALGAAAGGFTVRSAALAAGGFVLEALFRIELLLTCGENEFASAILANQYFVFKHGIFTSLCILA